MFAYLSGGLAIVTVGSVIYSSILSGDNESLRNEMKILELELTACGGTLKTVLDDVRSDNEINLLPDSALRSVPDHWLQPRTETDQ